MLICSLGEDRLVQEQANLLAYLLQSSGTMNVCFNLQERNASEQNPANWITEKMMRCQHVIFLCTPAGYSKYEAYKSSGSGQIDPFVVAVKFMAEQSCFLSRSKVRFVTVCYFKSGENSCVPQCLKQISNKAPVKVRQFCLETRLKSFFEYVSNGRAMPVNSQRVLFKSCALESDPSLKCSLLAAREV